MTLSLQMTEDVDGEWNEEAPAAALGHLRLTCMIDENGGRFDCAVQDSDSGECWMFIETLPFPFFISLAGK